MPGCLGLDAMWQLVGFYLGWLGEPGKGRALGVNAVKFTGEVLKNVKIARYQVDMKRILKKEGAVVGLADGRLFATSFFVLPMQETIPNPVITTLLMI